MANSQRTGERLMQRVKFHKREYSILLTAFFLIAVLGFYFKDFDQVVTFVLIVSGVVLMLLIAFFHAYFYYLILIAMIPLSLDLDLGNGAQLNAPSELMLIALIPVLFLFHKSYSDGIRAMLRHPITVLLLADIGLHLLTSLTSTHIDVSLKRWIVYTAFVLGFFFTVGSLQKPKQLLNVWIVYAVGLIPVMYFTFRNFQHYDFNPRAAFVISKPYFADHTLYGACLAFILPLLVLLCWNRKIVGWKSWQFYPLVMLTLLVIASEFIALSRAALLSLGVVLLFRLLLYWKIHFKTMIAGLAILAISALALQDTIIEVLEKNEAVSNDGMVGNHLSSVTNIQSDASNLERVNRWICAWRMFNERPLVGFGPGTYQFEYNAFQTTEHKTYISTNTGNKGNAHSEYLTYLSEKGVFGGLLFLAIVFGSIYFGMKNHETLKDPLMRLLNLGVLLGLVTYFFHGIFNSFMDQSKMAFLYFTALGTIVYLYQSQKRNEKEERGVAR